MLGKMALRNAKYYAEADPPKKYEYGSSGGFFYISNRYNWDDEIYRSYEPLGDLSSNSAKI